MAPATSLVSVEEYLATDYMPNAEYNLGIVTPKAMPTFWHSFLESLICNLINAGNPKLLAVPEQTVRIHESKYLIADVAAHWRDKIQSPYPTHPLPLCVEILSPEDRISHVFAKCEDFHSWGVPVTWIVDPQSRRAWIFEKDSLPTEVALDGALTANELSIPLRALFDQLPDVTG